MTLALCLLSLPPAQQHRFSRSKKKTWTADVAVLNTDKHPAVEGSADSCRLELVTWFINLRVSLTTLQLTFWYQL